VSTTSIEVIHGRRRPTRYPVWPTTRSIATVSFVATTNALEFTDGLNRYELHLPCGGIDRADALGE
jgi:hypothetical protein